MHYLSRSSTSDTDRMSDTEEDTTIPEHSGTEPEQVYRILRKYKINLIRFIYKKIDFAETTEQKIAWMMIKRSIQKVNTTTWPL